MTTRLFPPQPVVIVDDETEILKGYEICLRSHGINHVRLVEDAEQVIPFLQKNDAQVILLDIRMPKLDGEALLDIISGEYPHIPVIMVSGVGDVDTAVACMKKNAFDYMVKPVEKSRLVSGVIRAVEMRRLEVENRLLKAHFTQTASPVHPAFEPLITRNKSMKTLFRYAESIAQSPHPVLITGETGVGKELMARALHDISKAAGPFVSVNVAGIDDNTFSDTLFGHVKGAFTGAQTPRKGLVAQAANGTLFLDEIGDLRAESQIKLLRLLQEHEYFTLGSDIPRITNTRIIVATNLDHAAMVQKGRFRKDLYYRLSTHHIEMPPVRDRLDDLAPLLDHFLRQAAEELNKPVPAYPPELITLLSNYPFPGNVRELKGMVQNAISSHASRKLSMDSFKQHLARNPDIVRGGIAPATAGSDFSFLPVLPTLAQAQVMLIREMLKRTEGNKSMAAEMLGISRQRLSRLLKKSDE